MSKSKLTNCKVCDAEIAANAKACPHCGAKVKKPIFKKWWFWVIIVLILFIAIGSSGTDDSSASSQDGNASAVTETREEYIASCQSLPFEDLARNPDNWKGTRLSYVGQVIQVIEPSYGETVTLRVNVTEDEYGWWEDTILATVDIPEGNDRILEDDIITFYGECDGMYTYESIFGESISVPKIDIVYWTLSE